MKYIIEHMEEEISEWCLIEYKHISTFLEDGKLIFTNVKNPNDKEILSKLGNTMEESITELAFNNSCVLDPEAKDILSPKDDFDYLIFGGILGDYPARKRTKEGITDKMPENIRVSSRNLGDKQMATDTAVLVGKLINSGINFENIQFVDEVEIDFGDGESVQIPFRYVVKDGYPILAPGAIEYLAKEDSF